MAEQQTGRGARGVVAAAAPLAAALGAEAMRHGGTAIDGALTAALAETVLLPPKCGLGGDLVALHLAPGARAPEALLAIGGAPAGLAAAIADGLPEVGPLSVGVPAAPAGYAALAERATFDRARLAAPAVALAREGFCWAPICTVLADESRDLVAIHNPGGTVYYPGGRTLQPGEVVRLPGLALVLEEWAAHGADLLHGPVGNALVATVRERGGCLESDDLRHGTAEWVAPVEATLPGGARIWATPAPTHGPSLLDALCRLDVGVAPTPAAVWDAVQAAIAQRRATLADPRAEGTSMVSAADADGNVVVIVHSNSYPRFGSGLVVDGYDLILANRAGRGFTATPGHPNHPAPGRRPATTLHAWAAAPDDGEDASVLGGTPGGANQMPWNAQLLAELLTGQRDPGWLVTAPRWEWLPEDDGIRIEAGFDPDVVSALTARARRVEHVDTWGLRCAQQVVLRPARGSAVVAAVDPRTGGAAVAV